MTTPRLRPGAKASCSTVSRRRVSEDGVQHAALVLRSAKTIVEAYGGSIDATRVPPATDAGGCCAVLVSFIRPCRSVRRRDLRQK